MPVVKSQVPATTTVQGQPALSARCDRAEGPQTGRTGPLTAARGSGDWSLPAIRATIPTLRRLSRQSSRDHGSLRSRATASGCTSDRPPLRSRRLSTPTSAASADTTPHHVGQNRGSRVLDLAESRADATASRIAAVPTQSRSASTAGAPAWTAVAAARNDRGFTQGVAEHAE